MYIRKKNKYFIWMMFFLSILIISCTSKVMQKNPKAPFQFIGKIDSINALSEGETIERKRWEVNITVKEVITNGKGNLLIEGDKLKILVHSVVISFKKDRELLLEKCFKFSFYENIEKVYSGEFEIEPYNCTIIN